jgi:hypothetical protein
MNKTVLSIIIIAAIVVIGGALFLGGMVYARMVWGTPGYSPGGMMGYLSPNAINQTGGAQAPYGCGMMGNGMMNGGMMNNGMMGGAGTPSLYGFTPLSIETAKTAVESYLSDLGNSDLALGEVMIFDNQAYARVVEISTGVGAFEVLVDPVTLAVSPEPGPNMMWNLKYGMMSGNGMMGSGMMGRQGDNTQPDSAKDQEIIADMPVSLEQALDAAQSDLDTYLPGVKVEDKAEPFYGYYTIDIQRDGAIVGMLSVNGYTAQVFLHTWHGDFIEMSDEE